MESTRTRTRTLNNILTKLIAEVTGIKPARRLLDNRRFSRSLGSSAMPKHFLKIFNETLTHQLLLNLAFHKELLNHFHIFL